LLAIPMLQKLAVLGLSPLCQARAAFGQACALILPAPFAELLAKDHPGLPQDARAPAFGQGLFNTNTIHFQNSFIHSCRIT